MSRGGPEGVSIRRGSRVHGVPRVSVVIPAYRAAWLDEAIASARAQTLAEHEIIVVDDGSPTPIDPSDAEDIVLVRQPNAGPGGARNRGVELARGEWVAFLDADDRWRPEKLARQLALHERRAGVVLSGTSVAVMGAAGARDAARSRIGLGETISFERLFHENCLVTSSVMVSRAAWTRTPGMPAHRRLGEDYIQWLRLGTLGEIALVDEPLVERRRHDESLSHGSLRDGSWIEQERSLYNEFLAERPELRGRPFVRRALARLEAQAGYFHLADADWAPARRALVRSLRGAPAVPRTWLDLARSFLHVGPRRRREDA